jgi:hypothetical protein
LASEILEQVPPATDLRVNVSRMLAVILR